MNKYQRKGGKRGVGLFQQLKDRKRKRSQIEELDSRCTILNMQWYKLNEENELLILRKSLKVLEARNAEELDEKYRDFVKREDGEKSLGSIHSIGSKNLSRDNGIFMYAIEYKSFELKEGITLREWEDYQRKVQKIKEEIEKIEVQINVLEDS